MFSQHYETLYRKVNIEKLECPSKMLWKKVTLALKTKKERKKKPSWILSCPILLFISGLKFELYIWVFYVLFKDSILKADQPLVTPQGFCKCLFISTSEYPLGFWTVETTTTTTDLYAIRNNANWHYIKEPIWLIVTGCSKNISMLSMEWRDQLSWKWPFKTTKGRCWVALLIWMRRIGLAD